MGHHRRLPHSASGWGTVSAARHAPWMRFDLAATLLALLGLLAWEASGADLVVTGWLAGSQGFAWRDNVWLAQVFHGGGRVLAWGLLALMVADAVRPFDGGTPAAHSPPRRARAFWVAVVLACAIVVPGIKRLSQSSCPWDLAEFGGPNPAVHYVPHWMLGMVDGGPGHCFPSGHAVGVLAFIGLYFLWRPYRPVLARRLAIAVWGLGAVYGATQVLRGAHFVSHVLWSAWLCWVIALAADTACRSLQFRRRTSRRLAAAPVASAPGVSRPPQLPPDRAGCVASSPAE